MGYVLRTWNCQNRRCAHSFDSGDPYPPCPKCGCAKVSWQPGGGHLKSAATVHTDRTLKSVAANMGLSDMGQRGTTHRGEAVKRDAPAAPEIGRYQPMPGFSVPWSNRPTAGWADSPYPLKGTLPIGTHRFPNTRGQIPTQTVGRDPRRVPT